MALTSNEMFLIFIGSLHNAKIISFELINTIIDILYSNILKN